MEDQSQDEEVCVRERERERERGGGRGERGERERERERERESFCDYVANGKCLLMKVCVYICECVALHVYLYM